MYQNFNSFEARMSRTLRRYPILAIVGLALIVIIFATIGKPMLTYLVNWFHRTSYKDIFHGAEGTVEAQLAWAECIAELKTIGDMGWMGKLIVSVPSIVRIAIYVLACGLLVLAAYFLGNLWEASLDFGFWDKLLTGCIYLIQGIWTIAQGVLIFTLVVLVTTYHCAYRVYRKARKAYSRWKRLRCQQKASNPRRE